jgi:drug/metabolite transporter (DMT)-like permease
LNRFTRPAQAGAIWPWLLVALGAHTFWGIYPVLGRYLQTVSHIPSMSLLVVGYAPMAIIMFVFILPRYGLNMFRARALWAFALIVVLRSITNLLASRYTLAIYVQLITLMTPFIVAFLSVVLLRERLPGRTWQAMVLSFIGSLLIISSDIGTDGFHFSLTPSDWLGMGLATTSALFLALYMIAVRRTIATDAPSHVLLLFQGTVIMAAALPISLTIGEEWTAWRYLSPMDWLAVFTFMAVVLVGANGLQIVALRHLGASVVSSLMGWRLVSTLAVGMLLLGEGLQSVWQTVGMVIVLTTVTWYLWRSQSG